ncbi:MAG: hypothetical protein H3C63_16815 [Candidatus Omnitrophica bacterium]|nr:MAG: hypothetical protein UZ16_OP3001000609 [Candidatus Hinthialibacteria bacterium OLB16]MBE7486657.1 hypothetical protein [bacterium]MBW7940401.1 hypothetical protein [Candidatus Omnitrophota bacterium]MCE7908291.1 hypothetical protein [Candidatus Omnitrophica bacterium COP1]MBV6481584.1 hypothetical protein [bacterium]
MKQIISVLALFVLITGPVLAQDWEDSFYPPSDKLSITATEFEGVEFATDRLELMNESSSDEPGLLGRIGGFAVNSVQTVVETPVKFLSHIIGRKPKNQASSDGQVAAATPAPLIERQQEAPGIEGLPATSLELKARPAYYSIFEKSEGLKLANTGTLDDSDQKSPVPKNKGLKNKMVGIQILLQDIIFTDEK